MTHLIKVFVLMVGLTFAGSASAQGLDLNSILSTILGNILNGGSSSQQATPHPSNNAAGVMFRGPKAPKVVRCEFHDITVDSGIPNRPYIRKQRICLFSDGVWRKAS